MISGPQIRLARRLLGWSVDDLAGMAVVPTTVVERAEMSLTMPSIVLAQATSIQVACEAGGIVFGHLGGAVLSPRSALHDLAAALNASFADRALAA